MWEIWSTVIFCDQFILVIHNLLIAFLVIHSKHFIRNTISRLCDTSWSKLLKNCLVSIFFFSKPISESIDSIILIIDFERLSIYWHFGKSEWKHQKKNDSHWYFLFFFLPYGWISAWSVAGSNSLLFPTKRILFDWEINVTYSQTEHFATHS